MIPWPEGRPEAVRGIPVPTPPPPFPMIEGKVGSINGRGGEEERHTVGPLLPPFALRLTQILALRSEDVRSKLGFAFG